jgi:hypothetical protein
MALRDILQTILTDYPKARSKPFAAHPLLRSSDMMRPEHSKMLWVII